MRNLKITKNMRLTIEILMTILLLTLVSRRFTGGLIHRRAGELAILLFIIHGFFNKHWYKNLFKGSYGKFRKIQTGINLLLFIFILGVALTGISIALKLQIPNLRDVHKFFAFGSFMIIPLHIGLHVSGVRNMLNNKR